ncbi:MAG TPA: ATP-dependent DNA helicase RecG [Rhodothermales bacterium]|nr:ATP-dependent DNA helicase RecG [Rhodothermales bacterium]
MIEQAERNLENPLDSDIQWLEGVGPHKAAIFRKAGIHTFRDLFRFYPRRYLDRSTVTPIRKLQEGIATTVIGRIISQNMIEGGRKRFELQVEDESGGRLNCVWFNGHQWVRRLFTNGELVALHGTPQKYGRTFSLSHPEYDKLEADKASVTTGRIIPLYPGGQVWERVGLTNKTLRQIMHGLFKKYGLLLEENLPEPVIHQYNLMEGRVALRAIHFPKSEEERALAEYRLKFEEFFFLQLLLAMTRQQAKKTADGLVFEAPGSYFERFTQEILPFKLTNAQQKAITDVITDTRSGYPMNRLVQGDVGSGKTVVAIAAMMHATDSGFQSAFMAPTEILAEQHYQSLRRYLAPLGLKVHLLVGGQHKKRRTEILDDLATGEAHIAVGTHAIIEDKVGFKALGMAIVDEQHRFGVMQRARMFDKGQRPHMLLMTATPIPRSLAMTVYGDLDVTIMNELPANRKPIKTQLRNEARRGEVYEFIRSELRAGRQAYVVYPLVEESEKLDLKDAENGFEQITETFRPYKVGLVHGRMLPYEKDDEMRRFKSGELDILVATTVIEVGVDVPNASVMVIEHAERFGLSQLHQLRGRVGRGSEQSYCILMADYKQSAEAKIRLEVMAQTTDGFVISEEDLKLRGAGDFFGTRQSGLPDLKIANITQDADILAHAREAAFALVAQDPHLRTPENLVTRAHFSRSAPQSLGMARVG